MPELCSQSQDIDLLQEMSDAFPVNLAHRTGWNYTIPSEVRGSIARGLS